MVADEATRGDGWLNDIIDYFTRCYVGHEALGREVSGIFPKELWNMFQRVEDREPRTNNSLEAWHNAFAKGLAPHSPPWRVVWAYQREQCHQSKLRRDHENGRFTVNRRKKYKKLNACLERLIKKFQDGTLQGLDYLEKVASKIEISCN